MRTTARDRIVGGFSVLRRLVSHRQPTPPILGAAWHAKRTTWSKSGSAQSHLRCAIASRPTGAVPVSGARIAGVDDAHGGASDDGPGGTTRRDCPARLPSYAAAQLRHAPARGRDGPAYAPGLARPRLAPKHDDLPACQYGPGNTRPREEASPASSRRPVTISETISIQCVGGCPCAPNSSVEYRSPRIK
jgi:hypothetical protein